ncbi:MAG: cytochrome P450 [Pseudomonadota bacterium]
MTTISQTGCPFAGPTPAPSRLTGARAPAPGLQVIWPSEHRQPASARSIASAASEGYTPPKMPRGPAEAGHLDYIRILLENPVAAISSKAYRDPVVIAKSYRRTYATVCDPQILEEILVKRAAAFPKTSAELRVLGSAFGDGLLTAREATWRQKRKMAAPSFSPAAIAKLVPSMTAPFTEIARIWAAEAHRGGDSAPDVSSAMRGATLDVIGRLLFADPAEIDMEAIAEGVDDYLAPIGWISSYIFAGLPDWMPYPGCRKRRRAKEAMRREVLRLVQRRRRAGPNGQDMLGRLLSVRGENGERFEDEDLVDMVLTLVATGHETSAHTLTFALYCLAAQPALQEALAAEVCQTAGTGPIDAVPVKSLPRVEAFIKETLRLFPVVPMLARRTTQPERLGGHALPSGTSVLIPIYAIHRHERLWDRPDQFDITRFLDGATHPRTQFMPFGAGPRVCVGASFAMTEMVLGLAEILRSLQIAPGAQPCDPIHRVTLRPQKHLHLRVTARHQA